MIWDNLHCAALLQLLRNLDRTLGASQSKSLNPRSDFFLNHSLLVQKQGHVQQIPQFFARSALVIDYVAGRERSCVPA